MFETLIFIVMTLVIVALSFAVMSFYKRFASLLNMQTKDKPAKYQVIPVVSVFAFTDTIPIAMVVRNAGMAESIEAAYAMITNGLLVDDVLIRDGSIHISCGKVRLGFIEQTPVDVCILRKTYDEVYGPETEDWPEDEEEAKPEQSKHLPINPMVHELAIYKLNDDSILSVFLINHKGNAIVESILFEIQAKSGLYSNKIYPEPEVLAAIHHECKNPVENIVTVQKKDDFYEVSILTLDGTSMNYPLPLVQDEVPVENNIDRKKTSVDCGAYTPLEQCSVCGAAKQGAKAPCPHPTCPTKGFIPGQQ